MARENFLIIEDDPGIVELVQYNLEREGSRVFAGRDGESGLKEAIGPRPNLIRLDLMLPGIWGLEVCRTPKKSRSTRSTPLILGRRAFSFVPAGVMSRLHYLKVGLA